MLNLAVSWNRFPFRFLVFFVVLEIARGSLSWTCHWIRPRYESTALISLEKAEGGVDFFRPLDPYHLDRISEPLMKDLRAQLMTDEAGHWSMRPGDSLSTPSRFVLLYEQIRQRFVRSNSTAVFRGGALLYLTFEYEHRDEPQSRLNAALIRFHKAKLAKQRETRARRPYIGVRFSPWAFLPITVWEGPSPARAIRPFTHWRSHASAFFLALLLGYLPPRLIFPRPTPLVPEAA